LILVVRKRKLFENKLTSTLDVSNAFDSEECTERVQQRNDKAHLKKNTHNWTRNPKQPEIKI